MILTVCPNPSIDKLIYINELVSGNVNRSSQEKSFPGGKGVHVALALNELQTPTKLLGFWGGPTGQWIQKQCRNKNIEVIGPEIVGWNRTCLTILTDNKEQNNTEILEKGPEITENAYQQFLDSLQTEITSTDTKAICVSGSWPSNTPLSVYKDMKKICNLHQTQFWVDASGKWLEEALKVKPFGIHINFQEAQEIINDVETPSDYALKLLDYCELVALTNGEDGLYLAYQKKVIHASCFVDNDDIISTVGSGDCLTAGVISQWYKSNDLVDSALTGVACGAANCIHPELGIIKQKDVDYFKSVSNANLL